MSSPVTPSMTRYLKELASLLDKNVSVRTIHSKKFRGKLVGYDPSSLNIILSNAKDEENNNYARILIRGEVISEIIREEEPFDLKGLAQRLEKLFPNNVTLLEDAGVIIVMDKVRVTEDGVIEGSGVIAEKVKKIYEQFVQEKEKSET
ncbi:MAG: Lsm family RNA-binding protein [Candidatus Verstraetearchaeota archaeon]|jgi:small nuclear ribonucleoprotein (snRNP)-like protein|nr:Lsm family RNA-binding protein [Candidatus Culexarchaeum yellowstonense]MCS7367088.1 Lsm family RNA-binding protein [Candidatus Culexarchaeum yellowstonense]NHV11902.1 Lsm family RNA-binding protein [Candidatus Verstraetearchaeota archaeon]